MNEHHSQITASFEIRVDEHLVHPQVRALLREHLAGMYAHSPPECVHTLDASSLRQPGITFLTAWRIESCGDNNGFGEDSDSESEELMACGALKALSPLHSELKSMRTAARHLRQGAASALLTELLAIARQRGQERISLVTGSGPAFEPAWAMYRQFGFVAYGPFANYPADPFTRFMTLQLQET